MVFCAVTWSCQHAEGSWMRYHSHMLDINVTSNDASLMIKVVTFQIAHPFLTRPPLHLWTFHSNYRLSSPCSFERAWSNPYNQPCEYRRFNWQTGTQSLQNCSIIGLINLAAALCCATWMAAGPTGCHPPPMAVYSHICPIWTWAAQIIMGCYIHHAQMRVLPGYGKGAAYICMDARLILKPPGVGW